MSRWLYIEVERALAVDRGVDTILCTRQLGNEIVVQMSDEAIEKLKREISESGVTQQERKT